MPRTTDVRKMCDAEMFEVESSTTLNVKAKAEEKSDAGRPMAEILDRYGDTYTVLVYDKATW